jgi:DNA-binding winged helix-turn-helix (wHTH) protein
VPLPPKPTAVLWALASRAGQLVTKAELLDAAWPDTAVTDAVLTGSIRALREALGDVPTRPRYVETVHRRGYRFVAPVQGEADAGHPGLSTAPDPPASGEQTGDDDVRRGRPGAGQAAETTGSGGGSAARPSATSSRRTAGLGHGPEYPPRAVAARTDQDLDREAARRLSAIASPGSLGPSSSSRSSWWPSTAHKRASSGSAPTRPIH